MLKQLGIEPNRGGCCIVVSGQLIEQGPWSFTDEKTGELRQGYTFKVAYFGGVYNVKTADDDDLRNLAEGTDLTLIVPVVNKGNGLRQSGPAIRYNPEAKPSAGKAGAA